MLCLCLGIILFILFIYFQYLQDFILAVIQQFAMLYSLCFIYLLIILIKLILFIKEIFILILKISDFQLYQIIYSFYIWISIPLDFFSNQFDFFYMFIHIFLNFFKYEIGSMLFLYLSSLKIFFLLKP